MKYIRRKDSKNCQVVSINWDKCAGICELSNYDVLTKLAWPSHIQNNITNYPSES